MSGSLYTPILRYSCVARINQLHVSMRRVFVGR